MADDLSSAIKVWIVPDKTVKATTRKRTEMRPAGRPARMTTAPPSSLQTQPRAERVPPQDLDAEMALIGSMMMSREAIGEVIPIIGREDRQWF